MTSVKIGEINLMLLPQYNNDLNINCYKGSTEVKVLFYVLSDFPDAFQTIGEDNHISRPKAHGFSCVRIVRHGNLSIQNQAGFRLIATGTRDDIRQFDRYAVIS